MRIIYSRLLVLGLWVYGRSITSQVPKSPPWRIGITPWGPAPGPRFDAPRGRTFSHPLLSWRWSFFVGGSFTRSFFFLFRVQYRVTMGEVSIWPSDFPPKQTHQTKVRYIPQHVIPQSQFHVTIASPRNSRLRFWAVNQETHMHPLPRAHETCSSTCTSRRFGPRRGYKQMLNITGSPGCSRGNT